MLEFFTGPRPRFRRDAIARNARNGGSGRGWILTAAPLPALLQGVTYTGGKEQEGVWQRIVNLMPAHHLYVEPFLGGGALLRLKCPAVASVGIDLKLHGPTAAFFRARPDVTLLQECGISYLERLAHASHFAPSCTLVYCDPPYVLGSRRGRRYYAHEMDDAAHVRLLQAIRRAPFNVILSGYPSALYAANGFGTRFDDESEIPDLHPGWSVVDFPVMTRGHTRAIECLWFNFPRPAVPADVAHVGDNHRQRWRIEKRRRRLRQRFATMNPAERATLFAALVDVMPRAEVVQLVAPVLASRDPARGS